jgi:hypothetical protein
MEKLRADSMSNQATIQLNLNRDEAIVLFDFLQREIDRRNGTGLKPLVNHESELWALNGLNSLLERELAEPFRKDYPSLLSQAQKTLVERCGSWPD